MNDSNDPGRGVPSLTLGALFGRFLRFGFLAWGGPAAQIDMVRADLVDRERWISPERFRHVLGIYQALPGPEAHELCVYFGTLARGRIGGVVAGLGFMLPGLALMLGLSALYFEGGLGALREGGAVAVFLAVQAAVAGLIARAVLRLGGHAWTTRWFAAIGVAAACGQAAGVPFLLLLAAGGAAAMAVRARWTLAAAALVLSMATCAAAWWSAGGGATFLASFEARAAEMGGGLRAGGEAAAGGVGLTRIAGSGLEAGMLTFGGAYTSIPMLQDDAVHRGAWMTQGQFLDGIALSGMLPAPLIIFSTFVGYAGAGISGALLMTACVFLPAFSFSLFFHRPLERLLAAPRAHAFLDGVTAAAVGLIAATAVSVVAQSVRTAGSAAVCAAAFVVLWRWKNRWSVPVVIAGAAALGWASRFV